MDVLETGINILCYFSSASRFISISSHPSGKNRQVPWQQLLCLYLCQDSNPIKLFRFSEVSFPLFVERLMVR